LRRARHHRPALQPDPADRSLLNWCARRSGVVIRGPARHAYQPAYAEEVYVAAMSGIDIDASAPALWPVGAAGSRARRKIRDPRTQSPFIAPCRAAMTSSTARCGSTSVVPWEHVFFVGADPDPIARWLRWHHLYGGCQASSPSVALA